MGQSLEGSAAIVKRLYRANQQSLIFSLNGFIRLRLLRETPFETPWWEGRAPIGCEASLGRCRVFIFACSCDSRILKISQIALHPFHHFLVFRSPLRLICVHQVERKSFWGVLLSCQSDHGGSCWVLPTSHKTSIRQFCLTQFSRPTLPDGGSWPSSLKAVLSGGKGQFSGDPITLYPTSGERL